MTPKRNMSVLYPFSYSVREGRPVCPFSCLTSVLPSIHRPIVLLTQLSDRYPSIQSIHPSIDLSHLLNFSRLTSVPSSTLNVNPPVRQSHRPSIHPSIHPSVRPSILPYIHPHAPSCNNPPFLFPLPRLDALPMDTQSTEAGQQSLGSAVTSGVAPIKHPCLSAFFNYINSTHTPHGPRERERERERDEEKEDKEKEERKNCMYGRVDGWMRDGWTEVRQLK